LSSSMMLNVLIFAFLAGILGGLTSPVGAIVGGIAVGVIYNVAGSITVIGSTLETPVVLALIVIALLYRPTGLFGKRVQRRV
jgi:branched-chain amino acid transport system permease protein